MNVNYNQIFFCEKQRTCVSFYKTEHLHSATVSNISHLQQPSVLTKNNKAYVKSMKWF